MLKSTLKLCLFLVNIFIPVLNQLNNEFVFDTYKSTVNVTVIQTTPLSKVTVWSVDMMTSEAMLNVNSYIPDNEHGFWIIGFKSRIHEIDQMITVFGEVFESDTEGNIIRYDQESGTSVKVDEFCSNLPYYAGHNISTVLFAGNMYAEEENGRYKSIFDWRLKRPSTVKFGNGTQSYYEIQEKASRASIKQLVRCGITDVDYSDVGTSGVIRYTKVLYHTYIRVKDECLSSFSFDVTTCTEVLERTTLLIWTLSTFLMVSGDVESGVEIAARVPPALSAKVSGTGWYGVENQTDTEEVLIGTNITLKVNFTSPTDESQTDMYFYLSDSFNITDPDNKLQRHLLLNTPRVNMNSVLNHMNLTQDNGTYTSQIDKRFYDTYLSGITFPMTVLPSEKLVKWNTSHAHTARFNVIYETGDKPTELVVYQDYGHLSCFRDNVCTFSKHITRVRSTVQLTNIVSNIVREYTSEVKWSVTVNSVSGYNDKTQNISPLLGKYRPLYSSEKLLISFSVNPSHVLRTNQISLLFITGNRYQGEVNTTGYDEDTTVETATTQLNTSPATPDTNTAPDVAPTSGYLLYYDKSVSREQIEQLTGVSAGLDIAKSFGKFECPSNSECMLELRSQLFSEHESGYYNLTLGLKLNPRSTRSKRHAFSQAGNEEIANFMTSSVDVYLSDALDPYITRKPYRSGDFPLFVDLIVFIMFQFIFLFGQM